MNQRGFVIPPFVWSLLPYALGAIAVLGAATAAYQYVDNRWATDAGIAEGRKRESAKLQPQIEQARGELERERKANQVLTGAVSSCNAGVEAAKQAGAAAIAVGESLLEQARKVGEAAQKAAARSDAIARGPAQPGKECGNAWAEIESGRLQ